MKITKQRIIEIIKEEMNQKEFGDFLVDTGKEAKTNSQITSESSILEELITLLMDKSSSGTADSKISDILEYAKTKLGAE